MLIDIWTKSGYISLEEDQLEAFYGDCTPRDAWSEEARLYGLDADRPSVMRPKMLVEKKFIFGIPEIKELIVEYLKVSEGINIRAEDIKEVITGADYRDQRDYTRANAVFTATIKE